MTDYVKKFDFSDKTVFVLGGSGLIGIEICNAFLQFNAKVVVLDLKKNILIKKFSDKYKNIFYEKFNIENIKNKNNIIKILKKYKSCDVFINSIYAKTHNWNNMTFADSNVRTSYYYDIKKNIELQLTNIVWLEIQIANFMLKKNISGSIVNISSMYGLQAQDLSLYNKTKMKENSIYGAIKSGINNFSRQMAAYYSKSNIRTNNICPGGVFDNQEKNFIANYNKKVPIARMAKPDEIASAVIFLSSAAASYITGSTLVVDGGWTIK